MEMIHAVESKPVVVKGLIQQVNECKRLWLLKNSLSSNPQKLDRVRMPCERLSLLGSRHFLSPKIPLISEISSFSTATPDYVNHRIRSVNS
jgi:hypothetical protein